MESIRRHLSTSLLGGLAALWLAAGAGVLYSTRTGLIHAVDAQLAIDAQILRFAARGEDHPRGKGEPRPPENQGPERHGEPGRVLQQRVPAYQAPGSGQFYQTWNARGEMAEKSPSLGELSLPFPPVPGINPEFATHLLDKDGKVRTMSFRVTSVGRPQTKGGPSQKGGPQSKGERRPPPQSDQALVVTVAKSLKSVDEAIATLLGGIVVVGIVSGVATFLLIGVLLSRGLRPLRVLGEKTGAIDISTLHLRFDPDDTPVELRPVYGCLNDLMERLEKGFERERRFSSNLAHEMRTPVAELKMLSEVALKWPDQRGEATHQECLDISLQLESMIESLLALARWESGQVPLERESIRMETLVLECWESWRKQAEAKKLEIRFDLDQDLCLSADRGMLKHLIGNLLSNSVEYTPEEGKIHVSSRGGGIEIANDAPDLLAGEVEHLFDRFWRSDEAREDSRHIGLGLSLAKACAETMGFDLIATLTDGTIRFQLSKKD